MKISSVQIQRFAEVVLEDGTLFRVWDTGYVQRWSGFSSEFVDHIDDQISDAGLDALGCNGL